MRSTDRFQAAFTSRSTRVAVLFGLGLLLGGLLTDSLLAGTLEPPADAVDAAGDPKSTGATYPAWDKLLDSTIGSIH